MINSDLVELYRYNKNFNSQVKNNIAKAPEDFRAQLTKEEVNQLSRTVFSTMIMHRKGQKGGSVYPPYAFTESGIYMEKENIEVQKFHLDNAKQKE